MADHVEVIGAERFAATSRRAARDLNNLQAPRAGRTVVTRARAGAPKRSGRLAGSITSGTESGDVVVFSRLIYAPVIHNGWPRHNISANPFLARGLADSRDGIVREYTDAAQDALGQVRGA